MRILTWAKDLSQILSEDKIAEAELELLVRKRVIEEFGTDPNILLFRAFSPSERPARTWAANIYEVRHFAHARGATIFTLQVRASELANPNLIQIAPGNQRYSVPGEIAKRACPLSLFG